MKGMELCRRFYESCAAPLLAAAFPKMRHSAGLVGFGSDVLGYDDAVSRDHLWGSRLSIFPEQYTEELARDIYAAMVHGLPREFMGFPVGFGAPDAHGIAAMAEYEQDFRPLIMIMPFGEFLRDQIGRTNTDEILPAEWLAFSEQKLLALTKGRFFRDDLNLARALSPLAYYPRDVWLYLLYSDWSAIAEERAFVKRAAARGDDIGSRIICARIAHRLMHLCFIYAKRYAPYSKWFGTAFRELNACPGIDGMLARALDAHDLHAREQAIAGAQSIMIAHHNDQQITAPIDAALRRYYTRDITVAAADEVAQAIHAKIEETSLSRLPPIGSLSSVGNLTALCEHAVHIPRLVRLYEDMP
ncbi:MAG: DUF4037 domain-containing protein [Christensenellales bacterium]|jgi:hypothetical protein